MVKSIDELLLYYENFKDPYGKISREVKNKNLIPLVKGLYETNEKIPGFYLSAYIYGPSYLSFEFALSFHNLIPERVYTFTNATFNKRKRKAYTNHFGTFTYRDVPKSAYPHKINVYVEDGYSYFIASPEKAICDMLYISRPQHSMKRLSVLLFEDLRINYDLFSKLNFDDLLFLCDQYISTNMKILKEFILKEFL